MKKNVSIPDKHSERLYPVVLELLTANDFYKVDVRTISKTSGVSIGTIYKYFKSKEDLLFSILEEKIHEIDQLIRTHIQGLKSFKEIFRKMLWVTMDYYDRNPGLAVTAFITVPIRTWMKEASYRMLPTTFDKALNSAIESGQVDAIIDRRRFQDIYYMICYRCIHTWYYFGMKWTLVEAIEKDYEMFWKMLAPPTNPLSGNSNTTRIK